jgi:hypothetical protein
VAPTAIETYRQHIMEWSERLRFHLLQLKANGGSNAGDDAVTTQRLINEVVQALGQMQQQVMGEVHSLNQRYQAEIHNAPFWRRAFLQRKQNSEEAAYREITLLIEQVLLAAANIRETISIFATQVSIQPLPDQQGNTSAADAEPQPVVSEIPSSDAPIEIRIPPGEESPAFSEGFILQQELRRVADQWKWRLDTTRTLLESRDLSPERTAYIRGIQTTAWNVLQDIAALLEDESLTS